MSKIILKLLWFQSLILTLFFKVSWYLLAKVVTFFLYSLQNLNLPKNMNSSPASTPRGPGSTWLAGITEAVQSPPLYWSTEQWTWAPGPQPSAHRWPRATSCTNCRRRRGTNCRWRSPTAPAQQRRGSPLLLWMLMEVSLDFNSLHVTDLWMNHGWLKKS